MLKYKASQITVITRHLSSIHTKAFKSFYVNADGYSKFLLQLQAAIREHFSWQHKLDSLKKASIL